MKEVFEKINAEIQKEKSMNADQKALALAASAVVYSVFNAVVRIADALERIERKTK